MSAEQRVRSHVESERDKIISFMQRLIQTRSVTGEEAEICALLEKELTRDGLEVDIVEPKPGRVNIVAKHNGSGDGPKVMMYSHIDTVPAWDLDAWKHPPFSGEVADGYLWGRGAQDNTVATCGLTLAYRALKELDVALLLGLN